MRVTGINHYNLRANRATLDALKDFYVSIVGLRLGYRPPFKSFGYWLYVGTKDVLHLTEAGPNEQRRSHVTNTFDHVAFSGVDAESFERHLRTSNIQYTRDDVPLTGQRQLFFTDPAGNGVEINFSTDDARPSGLPEGLIAPSALRDDG